MQMRSFILRLRRDTRGASAIEYGIFAAFAAVVLLSGLGSVGGSLNGRFDKIGQAMAATPSTPPKREYAMERTADGRLIRVEDKQDHFLENHQ